MAKRQRKETSHITPKAKERRSYVAGGSQAQDVYKPAFPMSLFQNSRLMYGILGVAIIGALIIGIFASLNQPTDRSADDLQTPTAISGTPSPTVDPSATAASVSPTVVRTFSAAEQVIDPTKKYTATIKTEKGDIVMELFADKAPRTVNSFVFLARKGYFDGLTFHRVVKSPTPFVIQGGDPKGNGSGGPGYLTEEDVNDLKNTRGMVSMAKTSGATNFGSQFFVNLADNAPLDVNSAASKRFYPWAKVSDSSMSVVDQIAQGDKMISVTIQEQ